MGSPSFSVGLPLAHIFGNRGDGGVHLPSAVFPWLSTSYQLLGGCGQHLAPWELAAFLCWVVCCPCISASFVVSQLVSSVEGPAVFFDPPSDAGAEPSFNCISGSSLPRASWGEPSGFIEMASVVVGW